MKALKGVLAVSLMTISSLGMASDDRHFHGERVDSLSQAVKVFSEQNKKFAAMLEKGSISLKEMGDIHQMTYSMENALRKIKREVDEMEYLLEEVHEASEHGGNQKVLEDGRKYLEKAQTLVP